MQFINSNRDVGTVAVLKSSPPSLWVVAMMAATLLMSGCKSSGEYSGKRIEQASQAASQTEKSSSRTFIPTARSTNNLTSNSAGEINANGQKLYDQMCAACHAPTGVGTAIGSSLIDCPTCGDVDSLAHRTAITMPPGDSDVCIGSCASDIAEYIMVAFNQMPLNGSMLQSSSGYNPAEMELSLEQSSLSSTLRKAGLSLVGRLPSASEQLKAVEEGEQGVINVLDSMMEEDAFYERLMEIYNDIFLTDKYNVSDNALDLLNTTIYPQVRWYESVYDSRDPLQRADFNEVRTASNTGVAREPLLLIAHVVKNDLPFTEILTADYTLVNAASAKVYGVEDMVSTTDVFDVKTTEVVSVPGIPHAGVLTTPMFLNRLPTTETNRNRHRARKIFDFFLNTDILSIEGERPADVEALSSTNPTLDNPSCVTCHTVMDPVASLFQNWDTRGTYSKSDRWYADMESRGFNGKSMPIKYTDNSVQWLAGQIANDPRFAKATVRTLFKGLTGEEPLLAPTEDSADAKVAYLAQRAMLNEIADSFIADNYNLKSAIKSIILSYYWRAEELSDGEQEQLHSETGLVRLLTPEMLDRKIDALFGFKWKYRSNYPYSRLQTTSSTSFTMLYGGIDSNNVTKRITQPNGLMMAVQKRMANELSCQAVPRDLFLPEGERRLLTKVSTMTLPTNENGESVEENIDAIKHNIRYLHRYLLDERIEAGSEEESATYELFETALSAGQSMLESGEASVNLFGTCRLYYHPKTGERLSREEEMRTDSNYAIRAWTAVIAYMLTDYRFTYE